METGRQVGCNVVVCLVAFVVGIATIGERDMAEGDVDVDVDVVLYPSPLEVQDRARAHVRVLALALSVRCQDQQGHRHRHLVFLFLLLLRARLRCRHCSRGSEGRPCPRKMWEAPQSDKAVLARRDSGSWCSSIDQEVDNDQSCGLLFFLICLICLFVCLFCLHGDGHFFFLYL